MTRYFTLPADRSPESSEQPTTLTVDDAPAQTLRIALAASDAIPNGTGSFTMALDALGQAAAATTSECLVGRLADGAIETLCVDVAAAVRQGEQLSLLQIGHLHGDFAGTDAYAGNYVARLTGVRQQ